MLSILVTFLPNGIIYRSSQAAQIIRIMYIVQFAIYIITIMLCIRKKLKLVTDPVIGFIIWGIILLLSTFKYSNI